MSMHRKNKCQRVGDMYKVQPWFTTNVRRQRARNKIAKVSRRANR